MPSFRNSDGLTACGAEHDCFSFPHSEVRAPEGPRALALTSLLCAHHFCPSDAISTDVWGVYQ
jgi:hypothetical protein